MPKRACKPATQLSFGVITEKIEPKNIMKREFIGRWSIDEMEQWDKEYIDLVVPGYILIEKEHGYFQFGVVEGSIDWRHEKQDDTERIQFSWQGSDEDEPRCGRGWATVQGNTMHGKLFIHFGDDSSFMAKKIRK